MTNIPSFRQTLLALALVAVAAGRPDKLPAGYQYRAPVQTYQEPQGAYQAPARQTNSYDSHEDSSEEEPPKPFDFGYSIEDEETANTQGHSSNSDGAQVTGQYRVLLPDCRTQIVTYIADKENGFQAEVSYEGEICEYVPPPRSEESDEASYSAPKSVYRPPSNTYLTPNN